MLLLVLESIIMNFKYVYNYTVQRPVEKSQKVQHLEKKLYLFGKFGNL
jgi:hypothetical protein